MNTVFEVADFYLSKKSMSPKKLQKMVYYAYAWTLALLNETSTSLNNKLFDSRIEAWVHGPVVPELYQKYKGYGWSDLPKLEEFDTSVFSSEVLDVLNQVWNVYGEFSGDQLEQISHREDPWKNARLGLLPHIASSNPISDLDMFEFYNKQAAA